jgi:hypothetical protein
MEGSGCFFEKFSPILAALFQEGARPKVQKFFGSFFQKRTASCFFGVSTMARQCTAQIGLS